MNDTMRVIARFAIAACCLCRMSALLAARPLGADGAAANPSSGVRENAAAHYEPTEASLASHPLPGWYDNAKLGIFIHWGLYSVPAYATLETVGFDQAQKDKNKYDWYKNNAYAEWYYNTLLIVGSPTQQYHARKYGKDFDYYRFAQEFDRESAKWDPRSWAALFKEVGARYVVLTSKHHDGYSLWPTAISNPHLRSGEQHSQRDIAGELTQAVRAQGMRMGFYYSSVFDWSFLAGPIQKAEDEAKLRNNQGPDYVRYAAAQLDELIDRYDPDILWSDIGYPPQGDPLQIVARFYNHQPEGVTNNRWKPFRIGDFTTPEYRVESTLSSQKWEECRGLGRSFGWNRLEGERETIAAADLIRLLVDIVAKNGNLLLDVGPEPDGTIPPIQLNRLHALGTWLHRNGDAIFDTQPWTRAEGETAEGIPVRFTRKGDSVYVILLDRPSGTSITLPEATGLPHRRATLLGAGDLKMAATGAMLKVNLPGRLPGDYAWAIRLE